MISVRIIMLVEWVCPDYVVSMASNFAALKVLLMFAYSISMKIHYMLFLKLYLCVFSVMTHLKISKI